MEEIFNRQICSVCKKCNNCNKKTIEYKIENDVNVYFCTFYKRDSKKIIPYKEPLIVTAKRDYMKDIQI